MSIKDDTDQYREALLEKAAIFSKLKRSKKSSIEFTCFANCEVKPLFLIWPKTKLIAFNNNIIVTQ
jgi:hypothetical protein